MHQAKYLTYRANLERYSNAKSTKEGQVFAELKKENLNRLKYNLAIIEKKSARSLGTLMFEQVFKNIDEIQNW